MQRLDGSVMSNPRIREIFVIAESEEEDIQEENSLFGVPTIPEGEEKEEEIPEDDFEYGDTQEEQAILPVKIRPIGKSTESGARSSEYSEYSSISPQHYSSFISSPSSRTRSKETVKRGVFIGGIPRTVLSLPKKDIKRSKTAHSRMIGSKSAPNLPLATNASNILDSLPIHENHSKTSSRDQHLEKLIQLLQQQSPSELEKQFSPTLMFPRIEKGRERLISENLKKETGLDKEEKLSGLLESSLSSFQSKIDTTQHLNKPTTHRFSDQVISRALLTETEDGVESSSTVRFSVHPRGIQRRDSVDPDLENLQDEVVDSESDAFDEWWNRINSQWKKLANHKALVNVVVELHSLSTCFEDLYKKFSPIVGERQSLILQKMRDTCLQLFERMLGEVLRMHKEKTSEMKLQVEKSNNTVKMMEDSISSLQIKVKQLESVVASRDVEIRSQEIHIRNLEYENDNLHDALKKETEMYEQIVKNMNEEKENKRIEEEKRRAEGFSAIKSDVIWHVAIAAKKFSRKVHNPEDIEKFLHDLESQEEESDQILSKWKKH